MFVLIGAMIISPMLIVANYFIGYSFVVSIKWVITLMASVLASEMYIRNRFRRVIEHSVFSIMVFLLVPVGFIHARNDLLVSLSYVFMLCIGINVVFQKWERLFYTVSLLAIYLYIYVSYSIDIGAHISDEFIFYDRLVNIPLTVVASSIIIAKVAKSYRVEHQLLTENNIVMERVNEQLLTISNIDYLTKIYNRRYIVDDLISKIDAINMAEDKTLGIYLFDMDELKCHHYIEEIQKCIRAIEFPHKVKITVSGGYIKYGIERHRTVEQLLEEADKRLYIAKQSGKDKVVYR